MTTSDTSVGDPAVPGDEPEEPGKKATDPRRNAIEWAVIIVLALLAAFLIKTFLFQTFYIPSESMEPTLKISDRVLVNKLSYRWGDVDRGDLVVFKRPSAQMGEPGIKDLIKRVIALPGEKVEGRGGVVYVNDKPLNESYLPEGTIITDFPAKVVPPESYWVMGDNRLQSHDSRFFGAIDDDLIVGRAFVRVWPILSIRLL